MKRRSLLLLVVPSTYIFLSRLGQNRVFDRAWTLTSILLMGITAFLYTFELWAG